VNYDDTLSFMGIYYFKSGQLTAFVASIG